MTTMLDRLRRPSRPAVTDAWSWHLPALFDLAELRSIRVEEFRTDDHLTIRAELPGLDPTTDLSVTMVDDLLMIRAERREHLDRKGRRGSTQWVRSEFRYGAFSRTVELPEGCTPEQISAQYRNGILEVSVPVDSGHDDRAVTIPVTVTEESIPVASSPTTETQTSNAESD